MFALHSERSRGFSVQKVLFLFLISLFFHEFIDEHKVFAAQTEQQKPANVRVLYIPDEGVFDETFDAEQYLRKLFEVLSKYDNLNVSFMPSSMNEHTATNSISSDKANIIGLIGKSPERMFRFKFSEHPIAEADIYLVTDQNKKIYFNDVQELNGKSVSIFMENSKAKNELDAFIIRNNISMEYKLYDSYEAYLYSNADYHLVNSFYFIKNKQVAAFVGTQEMYLATTVKYDALLKRLDKALAQAQMYSSEALKALDAKYNSKRASFVRHELGAEAAQILENPRKVAKVGFLRNHYPIQYVNGIGQPAGITMDILKLLQQMHHNPTELVPYSLNDKVNISKFDMTFSVLGNKAEKEKFFYMSKPYAHLPLSFFTRRDIENNQRKKSFAILDYSVMDLQTVQAYLPQWEMKVYTLAADIIEAYTQGEVDGIILTGGGAEDAIAHFGITNHKVIPTTLVLPLHFYLSKVYPLEALQILNAFVDRLDPMAVEAIILAAQNSMRAPSTLRGIIREYSIELALLAFMLMSFFILAYRARTRLEQKKLHHILNTDTLTGLSTKEHAYEIMRNVLKRAKTNEYMIFCIDIDKFSLLNQVYGKEKADAILCHVAHVLQGKYMVKQKAECLARFRDDIFVVLLKTRPLTEEYDSLDDMLAITDGIKDILQNNYSVGLSRGCCIIDDTSLPIETLIDYAHAARSKGKAVHGFTTMLFTEDMKKEIADQRSVIYRMEQALENDEFNLYFQPKISLEKPRVCGAEVLVRWQPENAPTIYPDAFISVFESNAFISNLDMYVFEKTCKFIADHRMTHVLPPLAVNLSGISVLHAETYGRIRKYMHMYHINPQEIEIEITESAMVAESEVFLEAMANITSLGFSIAIDDFGTGVSSLHRLSSLNVDVVKLDKSFLDDNLTQKKGILLVASMIQMLHRLGMKVVAEGVETQRHVEILKKMQCDIAQGFYFSKPLPEDVFVNKLPSNGFIPTQKNTSQASTVLQ